MENEKQEKPVKTPGVFKKPIKEKKFEKRFVKYIEHPQDKKFFIGCFEKRDDEYVIRNDLSKDDVKKIKSLLKWVKKNKKSAIKIVPILFAGAVVAAVIIFFTTFANPLLESAMEKGLEAIFEAKSDVHSFRLSLLKFRIAIGSITVANRDAPMTNLFEMGKTEIRLKPEAVLRGKIYIEEIRADNIRFGTERKVSGALPERPPKVKQEKPKSDAPPMVDLQNFDAMALLNQEYDKLNTPKLYDEAIAAYNSTLAKWEGQVDSAKKKAEELRVASQPLLNLNVSNFNVRDVDAITKTVQDISTMVSTVQSAADEAAKMVSGIESDINMARQLEQSARNALTDDINHLKSYVNLGSGAAFASVEPFIRDVLSDTADQYLDYGIRALEALEKIKAMADSREAKPKEEKPKKEKKVAFKGRDVVFPVASYPTFYLGVVASDFTLDTWNWAFDLRNISSNPDLTGEPVSLSLGLTESGGNSARQVAFKGSADFRTNPPEKFNAVLNGSGFPVSLGDQMSAVGINGFSGETAFSVNMKGHNDGGVSAGGDVKISQARLIDPKGTLAEAAAEAVREAGRIDLGIQYIHNIDQNDEFKISSNIADLLVQALRRIAEAYAQRAMDEIERVLRERISQYIDDKFVSKEELDLLFRTARGDKDAMDQVKNTLNNKRNEFEQRLKTMADEALKQAQDEAKRQAEQAAQDLLKGQTPTLQVPSLPSGGGLRLPGR